MNIIDRDPSDNIIAQQLAIAAGTPMPPQQPRQSNAAHNLRKVEPINPSTDRQSSNQKQNTPGAQSNIGQHLDVFG